MKNVLIVFLAALSVFFGYMAISYNSKSTSAQSVLDEERFKRINVEEELNKKKEELATRSKELQRMANKAQTLEQLVEQTKLINKELSDRLDQAENLQKAFEAKILELQKMTYTKPPTTQLSQ